MSICASLAGRAKLVLFGSAILLSTPAVAKRWDTIPTELRNPSAPLELVLHIPQKELIAGRDPADVYANDEAIPSLMESAIQSMLKGGAQKSIAPTQDALATLEADRLLTEAVRRGIAKLDWVKMASGGPLRDNSVTAKSALLDQATGPQLLDVECMYSISQRFHAVYAFCGMKIASKAGKGRPESRWRRDNLAYSHTVEAEIILANPEGDIGGRRDQWTVNSAELLRKGLSLAINKVGELVGRQLSLTDADIAAAKLMPKQRVVDAYVGMAYDHGGPVLEGFENIAGRISPNPGGKTLLFKPGTDGVLMLDRGNNLFYYYSLSAG